MNLLQNVGLVAAIGLCLSATLPCQRATAPAHSPAFVTNTGQWPAAVRYQRREGGGASYFTATGFTLAFLPPNVSRGPEGIMPRGDEAAIHDIASSGVAVSVELVGANPRAIRGEHELPGRYHFLLGDDPANWAHDAVGYARIRYVEAWPGIDLVVRQDAGLFEYDLEVLAGADLGRAQLRFSGGALAAQADGSLTITTGLGTLRHAAPLAWTEAGGVRRMKEASCSATSNDIGFHAVDWDGRHPLIIDPGLSWSAYVGGAAYDEAVGVDVAPNGRIAVVGECASAPFTTRPGAFQTARSGSSDGFVSVFEPDGSALVFQTLYGGNGFDRIYDVAFDAQQRLVCGGYSGSTNLPSSVGTPAFGGGGYDAFLVVLSASGSSLAFGSYFGGNGIDGVQGFHFDAATNCAVIGGWTASTNLPTSVDAFQPTFAGSGAGGFGDGFVAVFDLTMLPVVSRSYASYFGGAADDYVSGLHRSPNGLLTLALGTYSSGLAAGSVLAPFQSNYNGPAPIPTSSSGDVFLAQLLPQAATTLLLYGSYFGGTSVEWPFGVEVDASGVITVEGGGLTVPTLASCPRPTSVGVDAFVARLDPFLPPSGQLVYGTFLGGSGNDNGLRLHVDPTGVATVVGFTTSSDLPVTVGAFQSTSGGAADGFVCRVAMDATLPLPAQLLYCTYVHGASNQNELVSDAQCGADGVVTLVGYAGAGMAMPYSPQPVYGGGTDGFLMRLVMPGGFATFGHGCNTLGARLVANPAFMPQLGATWKTDVESMTPATTGMAAIDLAAQVGTSLTPLGLTGCDLYVVPTVLQFFTAPAGRGVVTLSIPNVPSFHGLEVFVQAAVQDPSANAVGWALTHAGMAVVQ